MSTDSQRMPPNSVGVVPTVKTDSAPHLLAAAVDTFVNGTEEPFVTSLKDEEYQQLVMTLDRLITNIGADEQQFFSPLIDFIQNLLEKYEAENGLSPWVTPIEGETSDAPWDALLRGGPRGLVAAYSDDEPDYSIGDDDAEEPWDSLLRLGPRGIEAAYGDDEPDYTVDAGEDVDA